MSAKSQSRQARRKSRAWVISQRGLALHEAAHATVALALGVGVLKMTMRGVHLAPRSDGELAPKGEAAAAWCWRRCVIAVAGELAQRRADSLRAARFAAMHDREDAQIYAGALSPDRPDALLARARRRASRILNERWDTVAALARAIEDAGELPGDEVAKIFYKQKD